MRLCFDLDGVICTLKKEGQSYADVQVLPGAREKLLALKAAGHTIIIHTARHMKTCQGNIGLVIARQGKVTLDWLHQNEIPYDEIVFGKPYADIYIDDNGFRFDGWNEISDDGSSLPQHREKAHIKIESTSQESVR